MLLYRCFLQFAINLLYQMAVRQGAMLHFFCQLKMLRQRLQVRRIMPGITFLSVSSAHNGHQPKAIGLAAPYALTQQCPELLCIGHL